MEKPNKQEMPCPACGHMMNGPENYKPRTKDCLICDIPLVMAVPYLTKPSGPGWVWVINQEEYRTRHAIAEPLPYVDRETKEVHDADRR